MKKVTLPDGREVSRQRAHVINNPHAKELHNQASKKYHKNNPEKVAIWNKNTKDRFLEKNGVSYSNWYYQNVTKKRRQDAKEIS